MSLTKINASAATLTKNRTVGTISQISGMCATHIIVQNEDMKLPVGFPKDGSAKIPA